MIIGITGTLGAGKGTVVKYLVEEQGFTHLSARAFFQELMEAAGLPIDRDSMSAFANELRAKRGPGYVFDELFRRAAEHDGDVVIESLRTVGEAEALKSHRDAYLLAVDADQKLRYERIHGRGSALDQVSFEKFAAQEAAEMHGDQPYQQNIAAVMALADLTIYNDNDTEALFREVEKFLGKFKGEA